MRKNENNELFERKVSGEKQKLSQKIIFPKDFIFGAATSASQVEGGASEDGKGLSIWDVFSKIPGSILDGSTPETACDMYHKYGEDLKMASEMHLKSYRFSFSWSRIMPEGKGRINQKGLDYYKRQIEQMHKNRLLPNATLYHWDLPYELEREGGWMNREIVNWFGEYASLLYREFKDAVPMWVTINEPIATYVGYALGAFAPGRRGEAAGRLVNHHILLAHGEGTDRFRQENQGENKIGIVVDIWNHHPYRPENEEDKRLAEMENEKSYRSYLNPIFKGCYTEPLLEWMEENQCMPEIRDGDMKKISKPIDFFGLNCYNRVFDCSDRRLLEEQREELHRGGNYMDNGTEYYPKAVYDALHILNDCYQLKIPVYVTENGVYNCEEEILPDGSIKDTSRITYMKGFLFWIHKAMEEGIDVRGYYAWSLLDNWEWSAGYTSRFGMVHTDFNTQRRILKDSAKWYRQMIADRGFFIEEQRDEGKNTRYKN